MTFHIRQLVSALLLYGACCCLFTAAVVVGNASPSSSTNAEVKDEGHGGHSNLTGRYHVASFNFKYVSTPYIISLWILFASIAKIGFHLHNKLSSLFPESCMLIIIGILIGLVLYFGHLARFEEYVLNSTTFFLFLLPPIIFDAGYFMPTRAFFDNIGTILLYAVIGTLFNTFTIGFSIYGLTEYGLGWIPGLKLSMMHCLLFSSLISAVDPVAVLAVFESIHIDEMLHIIVFGESLLNDAVTVVLYHVFESFSEIEQHGEVIAVDIISGVSSFFVIGLVGIIIGILFGFLTGFITKYTAHVRVIEPLFVFVMSYLAYLTAEMFHFSGIMAIVFCGITMKQYVELNISQKSHTTVKYFMKMTANISETVIFMFLGTSTVTETHDFNIIFIVFTILFCLLYRTLGVIILTAIANCFRLVKLTKVDQFVMAYGGLRGAIAFSLVSLLRSDVIGSKRLFVTTTIAVIYFTVFVQGITIKPLVYVLKVKRTRKRKPTMNEQIHERFIDHVMAGIEDISGHHGHHFLRDKFEYYNSKYLKRFLVRDCLQTRETGIFEVFTKLNIKDAMDHIARHGSFSVDNDLVNASSISRIIRTASSGSFNSQTKSNGPGSNELSGEVNPSSTVLDMQSLDVCYSRKMADDSKIHHLVEENLFTPRKKWVQHRKHQLHDVENHPPFHHHLRTHLRHMIHQKKHANRRQSGKGKMLELPNVSIVKKNVSFAVNENENEMNKKNAENSHRNSLTVINDKSSESSDDDDDDQGITFTADKHSVDGDSPDGRVVEAEPTAVESSLPWKRDSGRPPVTTSFSHSLPNDDVPNLSEAPSWADNHQYMLTLHSPRLIKKYSSNEELPVKSVEKDRKHASSDFLFPPPWRTPSPSTKELQDSTPSPCVTNEGNGNIDEPDTKVEDSPLPFPWKHSLSDPVCPCPRDDNSDTSPAQTWTPHVPISDENSANGNSKHSDHINIPHVIDLPGHLEAEIAPQNVLFDKGDEVQTCNGSFDRHKRRPSFMKHRAGEMPRRASDLLPQEMNEEIDANERIAVWLRNSHPDNLNSPPIYLNDVSVKYLGRKNSYDKETNL